MRRNTMRTRVLLGVGVAALAAIGVTSAYGALRSEAITTAGGSGAANVNPKALVLRKADVPAGYRLIEAEASRNQGLPPGALAGYGVMFQRGTSEDNLIGSVAVVFRNPEDARVGFSASLKNADTEPAKLACDGVNEVFRRVRKVSLGADGWVYKKLRCPSYAGRQATVYQVFWRYDKTISVLHGSDISLAHTVTLAKLQQRRIVAALRG